MSALRLSPVLTTTGTHANDPRSRAADNPFVLSTKPTLSQARRLSNLSFISGVKRHSERDASFREAIERLADKGIVVEAWMRTSPGGIDLMTADARVVVESIDMGILEDCHQHYCAPRRCDDSLSLRTEADRRRPVAAAQHAGRRRLS